MNELSIWVYQVVPLVFNFSKTFLLNWARSDGKAHSFQIAICQKTV